MKYKIVVITQIYNELRKGNLERFIKYIEPIADELVVYDDASTDGSYEYIRKHTQYVIRGKRNDFTDERSHRQQLLDKALELKPDYILYMDADEVLTRGAKEELQELARIAEEEKVDGFSLHEINLWRSNCWKRTDNMYDDVWIVRFWRVTPELKYATINKGLHQPVEPESIKKIRKANSVSIIHYGFATENMILGKYINYRSHGQSGWELNRLIDESKLVLEEVYKDIFPRDLYIRDKKPQKKSIYEWIKKINNIKSDFQKPTISIVCLIYKSTEWLDFVYKHVLKHTSMRDKEFFFVANDASKGVLKHLKNNYIPHFVFNNTEEDKKEWYINNVYRAWNFGAEKARGDYIMFINSDMAFSPNWIENAFNKLDGSNCVSTRLAESGKMPSGEHGISKNFGQVINDYDEVKFLKYTEKVMSDRVEDGGLFMPLLIKLSDFLDVGGYPEGNVVKGSDLSSPAIAKQGEEIVSGDTILMEKLKKNGVIHQTSFDSLAYHFQEGEMDDVEYSSSVREVSVVVANDFLDGRMGERTMWNFLIESLPGTGPLDSIVVGKDMNLDVATKYIKDKYRHAKIIIQNATFIETLAPDLFTICYLQDDLRRMGRKSKQQEQNLHQADVVVTNSNLTAASYPEYDFEIIPIGVDCELFSPKNKDFCRKNNGVIEKGIVGIFVGDLSEVKGWSEIKDLIDKRTEITWIVVSKDDNTYKRPNVRMFNRISQNKLSELYNSADFFIIGSKVETQCLAAVEACMTNIPVIMRDIGIFADFTEEDKKLCGIFGDNFDEAINRIGNEFTPRDIMLRNKLNVGGMIDKWNELLIKSSQAISERQSKNIPLFKKRSRVKSFKIPRLFIKHRVRKVLFKILPEPIFSVIIRTWRAIKKLF